MHALNLYQLVVFDIADKLIEHWVVGRAGLIEQVFDHFYGPLVVGDHQLQKAPIKARRVRPRQLSHFLSGRHTGHISHGAVLLRMHILVNGAMILPVSVCPHRHWQFVTIAQPALHKRYLIALGCFDSAGNIAQLSAIGARLDQQRHV